MASSFRPAARFIWASALDIGAFGFFPYAVELFIRPLLTRSAVRFGAHRRHTEAKFLIPSVTRFTFKHGLGLGHRFGLARSLSIISRIDWLWFRLWLRLGFRLNWVRCATFNTVTFLLAPPLAFFAALVPLGAPVVAHAVVDLRRVVVILAAALITVCCTIIGFYFVFVSRRDVFLRDLVFKIEVLHTLAMVARMKNLVA